METAVITVFCQIWELGKEWERVETELGVIQKDFETELEKIEGGMKETKIEERRESVTSERSEVSESSYAGSTSSSYSAVASPPPRRQVVKKQTVSNGKKQRANYLPHIRKVLTDWLKQNLDNPFPSELDKEELVLSSGLSLTQVNNWFINARRRLVPKLLEERDGMYCGKRKKKYSG